MGTLLLRFQQLRNGQPSLNVAVPYTFIKIHDAFSQVVIPTLTVYCSCRETNNITCHKIK